MEAFRGWNAPDNEIANATRVVFIRIAQCACQSDVARFFTGRYCGVRGGPICSFLLLDDAWHRLRCAQGILNRLLCLATPLVKTPE